MKREDTKVRGRHRAFAADLRIEGAGSFGLLVLVDEGVEGDAEFELVLGGGELGAEVGDFGLGFGEIAGEGLGGGVAGFDGREALADVGETEDGFEGFEGGEVGRGVVGGRVFGRGRELGGGEGGGGGEVEVGLEAKGFEDGVEGAEEAGAAEPFAEDGGRRPEGGGWAAGFAEGAEKS
jgi:hypothetical protein